MVVRGVGARLEQRWTPSRFSQEFGHLHVMLVDVKTASEFLSPLRAFFEGFGNVSKRPPPPLLLIPQAMPSAPAEGANGRSSNMMSSNGSCSPRASQNLNSSSYGSSGGGNGGSGSKKSPMPPPPVPDTSPPLLKLKDWPPTRDFKEVLPHHFGDLMSALPVRDYTQRTGARNLASRLPVYTLPPDLGPKMYIAYGATARASEDVCLFGTTSLHMDMADAVNLMVYVEPDKEATKRDDTPSSPHGSSEAAERSCREEAYSAAGIRLGVDDLRRQQAECPVAGAIWDIWLAEDEPKLTAFLWRVAKEESGERALKLVGHPVHDANIYLTANLRQRLWQEEGVIGFRHLQCEGEAVFIPAGCPHQVYNIRSSIKVAEDFVSPEHIERCLTLTEQFRALPLTHRRKQDALGAKDIMLHAVSHALSLLGSDPDV